MTAQLKPTPPSTPGPQKPRARTNAQDRGGSEAFRFKRALKEARTGLLEAQYQVGLMLASGAGVRKDLNAALVWMTQAAERGHAGAQFMLGCHYGADPATAPRGQVDEARAMDWLYLSSRQGHARAHHRLGQLLRQSWPQLSAHHDATAASLGLAESQLKLAQGQLRPDADPQLQASGRAWLRRAAAQGLAEAQTELGIALLEESDDSNDPPEQHSGLQWLRAAADQGWPPALLQLHRRGLEPPAIPQPVQDPVDAAARHALGELFARGVAGLHVDLQQASQWFLLAAVQRHAPAHMALGQLLEQREPQASLDHYRSAANIGLTEAQFALSRLLCNPSRPLAGQLEGQRWLVQAAAAGHPQALLDWSDLLMDQDLELAQAVVAQAARAGLPEAQYRHALQLLRSTSGNHHTEAVQWLEQAALGQHRAAICRLGIVLCSGDPAVRDRARGLRCIEQAADAGDPTANWHLALMHAAGANGLVQDSTLALTLCRLAADTGFAPALATMGLLCAGLDRHDEAVHWWRQAAQAHDAEAQFNLARALQSGRGTESDDAQAVHWMQQAAEAGLPQAQVELAIRYSTGQGLPEDTLEAHKWFLLARNSGSAMARHNVDLSSRRLGPDQIEEAERRARSWRARQRRHD
jgi:uncharacterized protein